MAHVRFTAWLREVAPQGPVDAAGGTVGEVFASLLAREPHLRSYLLDDQGRLRKHVCVFADGQRLAHNVALGQAIGPDCELYVMQALSGG